jgi:hypothetical protein
MGEGNGRRDDTPPEIRKVERLGTGPIEPSEGDAGVIFVEFLFSDGDRVRGGMSTALAEGLREMLRRTLAEIESGGAD